MARRCLCARLLGAVQEDPRLRTLPLAARMLFLLVAEAAARSPVPGVLPFSGAQRVSLLVSAPETDVQTQLETLRAEDLLVAPGDGTLVVPLLVEAASRSDVARRNGAKGGRPRRGESPEAYQRRRQTEMLLPLPGGPARPEAETQETQPAKPAARASTTTESPTQISEEATGRAPAQPEWVSLGAELVELAQLDTARFQFTYLPVKAWLDAGCTVEAVRAAVQRAVARPNYQPGKIRTLAYFDQAVERERGAEGAAHALRPRDSAQDLARIIAAEARVEATLRRYAAA